MSEQREEAVSPVPFFKKVWFKILVIFIIILFAAVVIITKLLFAPWENVPPVVTSFADISAQYRLMKHFSRDFSKQEKIPEKSVIKLSENEINSLFRLVANITPNSSPYPLRYYRLSFSKEGIFSAALPLDTGKKWLWGGTLYLKVRFTLSKEENASLQCRIISLQATSLPLSSSLGQKAVDIFMNEEKIQKDLEKINKVLRQVTFDGKKLVITYNSVQLSNALSRFPSPD